MSENRSQKKIVLINTVLYGSTGNIVRQLKSLAEEKGMKVYTVSAYTRNSNVKYEDNDIIIGNLFDRYLHIWLSRVTGLSGTFSFYSTLKLTKWLRKIEPDVIHLHNLHNAYINLPILFKYIKRNNVKVLWTLHDCWAFTGRCPHFEILNCDKWRTGCHDCPYPAESYPIAFRDNTKKMWTLKKNAFTGVKDMTLVTPSKWLAKLVKQSFLANYPTKVINNGINIGVFMPIEENLFKVLKADGKHIVLGVAMDWNIRKGLDVFKVLCSELGDEYKVVMVGTDKKLAKELGPYGIVCVDRTSSQQELAEIYTAADVFVNPTREDNFPTVNIEALACGTPVITFDTGGSSEMLDDMCGIVVSKGDINGVICAIKNICENEKLNGENCVSKASQFNSKDRFMEYIDLYSGR